MMVRKENRLLCKRISIFTDNGDVYITSKHTLIPTIQLFLELSSPPESLRTLSNELPIRITLLVENQKMSVLHASPTYPFSKLCGTVNLLVLSFSMSEKYVF